MNKSNPEHKQHAKVFWFFFALTGLLDIAQVDFHTNSDRTNVNLQVVHGED